MAPIQEVGYVDFPQCLSCRLECPNQQIDKYLRNRDKLRPGTATFICVSSQMIAGRIVAKAFILMGDPMGEKAPEDPMRIFAIPVNPLCPITDNPPNQVKTYNLSNRVPVKL